MPFAASVAEGLRDLDAVILRGHYIQPLPQH